MSERPRLFGIIPEEYESVTVRSVYVKLEGREMNERKGNSIDRKRSLTRDHSRQVRMNESIEEIKLMARG